MSEETGKEILVPARGSATPKVFALLATVLALGAFAFSGFAAFGLYRTVRVREDDQARRTEALLKTLAAMERTLSERPAPTPAPAEAPAVPGEAVEELVKALRALREGLERWRVQPPPRPAADGDSPMPPAQAYAPPGGRLLVLGAVQRPGVVVSPNEETALLTAIALAGGPSAEAGDSVEIRRAAPGEGQERAASARYALRDVMERREPAGVVLQEGDMVFVQERRKGQVFIVGEVKNPGAYAWSPDTTVFQAVVMAGGFTRYANRNAINIARTRDGQTSQIRATGNTPVLPNDIVFVTESWF